MDRPAVEAALREILREYVRHPERPIAAGDHLLFDLEIPDDDLNDLVPEILRRFGIDPPLFAWSTVATFADVVALVEHWQRHTATSQDRARDEAERREAVREGWKAGTRVLATFATAAGMQLAGGPGGAVLGLAFAIFSVGRMREDRRIRRERAAWKAQRGTRT